MDSDTEIPEYNPYAVPDTISGGSENAVNEFGLSPEQDFRVLGRQLICRNPARFADTCWMTGTSDVTTWPMIWKSTLRSSFFDTGWFQLLQLPVFLAFVFDQFMPWSGFAIFVLMIGPVIFSRAAGEQFKFSVGQSVGAVQHVRHVRWFVGIQVPVCFMGIMWVFLQANESPLLIWMSAGVWLILSMVYWFRLGLTIRNWQVRRHDEDSFVVTGLNPRFLQTLYLQQWANS